MPCLIEGAGPEARPFQGCIPYPPLERVDVDGPAFLIQEDIVVAQLCLSAISHVQIVNRLEHLHIANALLDLEQLLVFADASFADCYLPYT
jgi:hypothetical protein